MNTIQVRWLACGGLAGALILFAGSGCGSAAPASSSLPVPKVTVMPVVSQETLDADEYIGKTEASEIVEVRSRVFGFLKTIEFQDGDSVTEGKVLFTIEPDEYKAIHQQSVSRIALNDATLALAKAKHARNEVLVKTNAVTREEYEESLAAVKSSEAAISAARADADRTAVDLKYTEIKAPINGRIDRAMVSKGNLLTGGTGSGTLLTKIVNEQPMYVYFDVDERSLLRYMRMRSESRTAPGSLRDAGIACSLQLADEKDFPHTGKLDFVETEVNPSTGTARLRGVFANESRELASGLFVRVRIPVSKPYQAMLIPEQALATDQSIKFVYVVGDDGTAKRRNVELGPERGEMRIITSGLQAGERVIVKGLQRVKPDQKVEAETAQASLPPSTMPPAKAPTTVRKPVTPAPATKGNPGKASPANTEPRNSQER
ncbi:MAG TPA: efflux RND transporter periplasmic adaptor subunit [Pirellulaceae bacterium]|nr:efflux RND transporter periplasmic adaptor subunit [Pirellulaceae bacterium]